MVVKKGGISVLYIIGYVLLLLIYACSPLLGKLILMVVNFATPDPLPFIDEAIMIVMFIRHLAQLEEWIDRLKDFGETIGKWFRKLRRFIVKYCKIIITIIIIILVIVVGIVFS